MPKKRKNRGKPRNQKKLTTIITIDTITKDSINDYESEYTEYVNENEKLKKVIARLENKLQESVVRTETNSTVLSKCANTVNESSSVAKSSSSTVVQNANTKKIERFETAASSSCSVFGNIVIPDPSPTSSHNNYVKKHYKCNFCDFKLERIFENRKRLLDHLRTHKFPYIQHQKKHTEIDERFKADETVLVEQSITSLNNSTSNITNIHSALSKPISKPNLKNKQPQNATASIQKQFSSSVQTSLPKNNIEVEESTIDAYYSSMDKRKNRSTPYIICNICNIKFTHRSSYVRHKISQHSNQESALNPRTGEPFDAKQKICTQCNQVFSRESVLNQHISTVHYGLKPFECEYCKRRFSAKSNLFEHVRTHTRERPYNCEYCKTTFPYRSTLTTHIKNVHKNIIGNYKPPESNFRCKYCNEDFPSYSQRYRHSKQEHLKQEHPITAPNEFEENIDEDPLSVQNIGSIIEIESNDVEIHSVYVDQYDVIEVCNEPNELLDEVKEENEITGMLMDVEEEYIEDSEHQYIDDIFEQNIIEDQNTEDVKGIIETVDENVVENYYDNISDIIEEDYLEETEVLNYTNDDYIEYVDEQVENSTSNLSYEIEPDVDVVEINSSASFKYEEINEDVKSFEKSKEFKHLINTSKDNIDANEINKLSQEFIDINDPKKCSKCGISFSRVAVLHQHIKSVHLQLKPYKCGYCDKKFASRSNLIEHIRLHTGEKPYKCRACNEDFNRRGLFTKHVKIAHPEQIKELLA